MGTDDADHVTVNQQGNGLLKDVFERRHMAELNGNAGIGHVRYPTAGADDQLLKVRLVEFRLPVVYNDEVITAAAHLVERDGILHFRYFFLGMGFML